VSANGANLRHRERCPTIMMDISGILCRCTHASDSEGYAAKINFGSALSARRELRRAVFGYRHGNNS
jgi:hypothetical protein